MKNQKLTLEETHVDSLLLKKPVSTPNHGVSWTLSTKCDDIEKVEENEEKLNKEKLRHEAPKFDF